MIKNGFTPYDMAQIYLKNLGLRAEVEVKRFIERTQLSPQGKDFWNMVLEALKTKGSWIA